MPWPGPPLQAGGASTGGGPTGTGLPWVTPVPPVQPDCGPHGDHVQHGPGVPECGALPAPGAWGAPKPTPANPRVSAPAPSRRLQTPTLLLAPTALVGGGGESGCLGQVRAEVHPPEWVALASFLGTGLQEVTATSRDQKELLWAWQGWRDAMGRQLRSTFERYVQLSNKAA